jgi:WD40 repeat protein
MGERVCACETSQQQLELRAGRLTHCPARTRMQAQQRAVTCLDCDPSGSRLVTGSLDFTVRMFDFSGMKSDLRSFR